MSGNAPLDPSGAARLRPLADGELAELCERTALLDPWRTLGLTADWLLKDLAPGQGLEFAVAEGSRNPGGAAEPAGWITFIPDGAMAHFRHRPGLLDRVLAAVGPEDGAYVRDLAVFPGWQGRGIGSLLLGHCARRTREVGLGRIFLNCSSFNEGARRFYERHGFRWVLDQVGVILPQYSEQLMVQQLGPEP